MKQKLTFQLDDPTTVKYAKWRALGGEINKLCVKEGLIINSRLYDEDAWTSTVESIGPDRATIFRCTHATIFLLAKHDISTTCIGADIFEPPKFQKLSLQLTLKKEQQTEEWFQMWLNVAKTIDAECRRLNIYIQRVPDPDNFAMHLTVQFTSQYDWAYLSYFAGNACGKAGIELMHYELDPISILLNKIKNTIEGEEVA